MSSKSGKVVAFSKNIDIEKKGGGTYKGWQLIFTMPNGKVETVAKHMNSLKFTPGLESSLDALVQGEDVTINFEKKGEFNEVVSVVKGLGDTAPVASAPTTKVAGSNYETREERAARQRLIVRQSSITAALSWYTGQAGNPTVEDIKVLAEEFTDFVFETNKPEAEVE